MKIRSFALVLLLSVTAAGAAAQTAASRVALPPPDGAGRPLMEVLRDRHSERAYADTPLPAQELSNLLWAAFGINRPESGRRTAPSAMNWQEIDVYVAAPDGLFRYVADGHALERVHDRDIRAATGTQPFVASAAVNLVYVADETRMRADMDSAKRREFLALDAGFVAENACLYCASAGLATVVRASFDQAALAKAMGLAPTQWIVLAQSVGFPAP